MGYNDDQLEEYEQQIVPALEERLLKSSDRYPDAEKHLDKIRDLLGRTGTEINLEDIGNFHNEVCVAINALGESTHTVKLLEYEPKLPQTDLSIDLRVTMESQVIWIDIKTIRPQLIDRWKQFIETRDNGRIPESVTVSLNERFGGGEIWHSMFASRARMLEYSSELETKIAAANLPKGSLIVLMCCGDGIKWQEDELEDFVHFYRTGEHRLDDPFSLMESHYLKSEGLSLQRIITGFGLLFRQEGALLPDRVNWNVQPPTHPR